MSLAYIKVFLKNGQTLETCETFEDSVDPVEAILEEIENRESPWKEIGSLFIDFREIAGFAID